jgi:RHS repeat-associated protein
MKDTNPQRLDLDLVRHVTDESGDAIGTMRYSPFGQRVESTGLLPFMGFTGEPQDPSSDLTYLRARYYNPDLGRFITADSIIPDPTKGQAWNRYAYVYNDVKAHQEQVRYPQEILVLTGVTTL